MVICVDTSFLFAIYGTDVHTPVALDWLHKQEQALTLSSLNEFELCNALRLAEFRRLLPSGGAEQYWAQFEQDRQNGLMMVQACNLSQVVNLAKNLSQTHTVAKGCRSFDILHVASALQFGASCFLTFDRNQQDLARAEGLSVPL
jgi:predicted nucleic acid-binding protein